MSKIGVINLGNSNLTSLTNSLDYLNIDYQIINKSSEFKSIDKIILPGVGAFGKGMDALNSLNFVKDIVHEVIYCQKPILGICLGMQLLFESSEESPGIKGLSLLKGKVKRLALSNDYKIPRIGWSESTVCYDYLGLKKDSCIDFYFIHSYHVVASDKSIVSIKSNNNITSAVFFNNIFGCQFHPEKSHIDGLRILNSFSKEV